MKKRITTWSGSVYLIDQDAKTWERVRGDGAAKMRSDSGTYAYLDPLGVGLQIYMECPPFDLDVSAAPRLITSTPIISIEDIT